MPTSTKSLKCPACKEASCRLSVKLRSLRASGSKLWSLRKDCNVARLRMVVAVLRPSDERTDSLP